MMATIRTVSTHGQPEDHQYPVVYVTARGHVGKDRPGALGCWTDDDQWTTEAEAAEALRALPPTPRPPVTITIPRDVAKQYATRAWIGRHPQVIAEACREALEGDR